MEYDQSILMQRVEGLKITTEARHTQSMTLHCDKCNTVLGDSLSVCGDMKSMSAIVCIKVTNDVLISDTVESGHNGELANCIYSSLRCCGCRCTVGRVIHAASSRLDTVRSLFLLYKANISCYILNSCSMVKASTLTFDKKPLRENVVEVRRQFEAQLDLMLCLQSRLADKSDASGLEK